MTIESPKDPLVLVVDDDKDLRQFVRTVTAADAQPFLTASNVQSAIQIIKEHSRDYIVVFMDYELQGTSVNGIELLRCIQEEVSDRVLGYIWTGHNITQEMEEEAVNAGAHGVFGKDKHTLERLKIYTSAQSAALRHLMGSTNDVFTGIPNFRDFQTRVIKDLEGSMREARDSKRKRRHPESFNLFCLDMDDFKRVNDEYGHQVGSEAIKAVAHALVGHIRETDRACRYGGDEFLVSVSGDTEAANKVKANLKRAIAETPIADSEGRRVALSVTIGSAQLHREKIRNPPADFEDLFRRADASLRRIKQARRIGR